MHKTQTSGLERRTEGLELGEGHCGSMCGRKMMNVRAAVFAVSAHPGLTGLWSPTAEYVVARSRLPRGSSLTKSNSLPAFIRYDVLLFGIFHLCA